MTNLLDMNKCSLLDVNTQSKLKYNYEIFERLLVHARDKYRPINNVQYRKNKHNLDILYLKNGPKQVIQIMLHMTLLNKF